MFFSWQKLDKLETFRSMREKYIFHWFSTEFFILRVLKKNFQFLIGMIYLEVQFCWVSLIWKTINSQTLLPVFECKFLHKWETESEKLKKFSRREVLLSINQYETKLSARGDIKGKTSISFRGIDRIFLLNLYGTSGSQSSEIFEF